MKRYLILAAFALAAAMQSCYPEGPEYASDMDVAITSYKSGTNFKNYSSFTLPDTIIYFDNRSESGIGHSLDGPILRLIANEFESFGYTRIDPEEDGMPSFVVTVSAFSQKNYSYYINNWGNNWNWYWGSLWPGYTFNPYYSWMPPYGFYSYQDGSIVIDMIDNKTLNDGENSSNKNVNVLWNGTVSGILTGSNQLLLSRILDRIEQCFEQSESYLNINTNR